MHFLSAPYSHDNPAVRHARYKVMQEAAAVLALEGVHIYSPICAWHEAAQEHDLPTDAVWWKKYNFDAMNRCDGYYLLALPGWEESVGVQMESGWADGKEKFSKVFMVPYPSKSLIAQSPPNHKVQIFNLQSYKDRQMTLEV